MPQPLQLLSLALVTLGLSGAAMAVTLEELNQRAKDLPTVPEAELPPLGNEREAFQGTVHHPGLVAHTWVRFPFVENPGSLGIDKHGRVFVAESHRFWHGVPDLRGANELIRGDFQSVTVEDRQRLYEAHYGRFPADFFTRVADRIIRLEDRDGNGAADHRTLFSDHFDQPLDGLGFSILPEEDAVYFTCIPHLWKLTDADDDGVADSHESLVDGFGARVSFIGHDLHGITRGPDGMLYFSVGDRGYHVTTPEGETFSGPGRGAIFRCHSDGSGFEVFCTGLRNPQELAFDDLGNLFTFDNTGDIGDEARMVYALEGSDSGWNMAHQSAHHYREALDWGAFHPEVSVWVAEQMFETYTEDQPQWVYPPASHVANGPSGVTFLTGEALPADLRGKFLLANYRGAPTNCTVLTVGIEPVGAGYHAVSEDVLVEGVGVSDVELGFDGNLYLCDFGGGWEVNSQGAIHVLAPSDGALRAAGQASAQEFAGGLGEEPVDALVALLHTPDRRMRQLAQFELASRGEPGRAALVALAGDREAALVPRLHAIWGLGQLGAGGKLLPLAEDPAPEIRANAARTIGLLREPGARDQLVTLLGDPSPRVRSLAAIALGRVAEKGDTAAISALYGMAEDTGKAKLDPVLRHSCLAALDQVGTIGSAVARATAGALEVRMTALLYLRRQASEALAVFLDDPDPRIRREAVRAIYDTPAIDGPAGAALAERTGPAAEVPPPVQRRLVAANYRRGGAGSARRLVAIAGDSTFAPSVRAAALHGLQLWEQRIDTDPVSGDYRPLVDGGRTMPELGAAIDGDLRALLATDLPPALAALALQLADASSVSIEQATLRGLVTNAQLAPPVRVAALDSLVGAAGQDAAELVDSLLADPEPVLAAAAIRHGFTLASGSVLERARSAISSGPLPAARAAITGLVAVAPAEAIALWNSRDESPLRRELWLDLWLALQASPDPAASAAAAQFAAASATAVFSLSETGGIPTRGEAVFRNQGACLQCHKMGADGGIQGPALTTIGARLSPAKLVESLVNPSAEIAENYGLSTISLNDGTVITGRVAGESPDTISVVAFDGKPAELPRATVAQITPPISAMPPLGASLPPRDLRDLVAYLASRTGDSQPGGDDAASHGEDIAK